MPELSRSAKATVTQFAQDMGLQALQNSDGSFGFDFETSGRLSILAPAEGDGVLITLTRRLMLEDVIALGRFSGLGGYHATLDRTIHTGLTKADQPVLAVTLSEQDFSLPGLDAAFAALEQIHTSLDR